MLANQARTIGSLSGGRFALTIAIAASEDDYADDSTVPGRAPLDRQLEEMKRIWKGRRRPRGASKAQVAAGPSLIVGGTSDAALEHVARFGEGWIMGSCSAAEFAEVAARVGDAWSQAGREGKPLKLAVANFSLGAEAPAVADRYVDHYYSWAEEYVPRIRDNTATSREEVEEYTKDLADAGCDELILFPVSKDPEQVDLLAKALGRN
jgi:alkanesulfonate monooxygenase SsuD/methylene tetrahydromethanopterin reductase-like flavin-dependent oxidoreductase (luciferase family)